jgi:hypothetical protein
MVLSNDIRRHLPPNIIAQMLSGVLKIIFMQAILPPWVVK